MLYIINVAESGFQEMRSKRRKYSLRYRRAIDGRRLGNEELDELGLFLRHLMDVVEIGFGIMDITEIFIIIASLSPRLAVSLLSQFDGCTHNARHAVRLLSATGTLHGGEGSLLVFAEGGDDLLDPSRIVIAKVAEIAGKRKDKGITGSVLWFATKQFYQLADELIIGNALVLRGEDFRASIRMSSSRAEITSSSTIAITRLGRLNSRARRNSRMAVSARKSIVLNI